MAIFHQHTFKLQWMVIAATISAMLLVGCGGFDKEPPVIRLIGFDTLDLGIDEVFVDPGAIAFDKRDLDISDQIQTIGTVTATQLGLQEIEYSVSDAAGNVATAKRYIQVVQSVASLSGQYQSRNNCGACTGSGACTLAALDPIQHPKSFTITPAVGNGGNARLVLKLGRNLSLSLDGTTTSTVCGLAVSAATGRVNAAGDSLVTDIQFANGTFCSVLYSR